MISYEKEKIIILTKIKTKKSKTKTTLIYENKPKNTNMIPLNKKNIKATKTC